MLKLLIFLSLNFSISWAQSPMDSGIDAFQKGDYVAAQTEFAKQLSEPKNRTNALYNLGNIAVKLKKPGEALAYYRRALIFTPHDKDLLFNTRFVIQQFKISPPPGTVSSYEVFRNEVLNLFSFQEFALVSLFFLFFFSWQFTKFLKKRLSDEDQKPYPAPIVFIWLTLAIVTSALAATKLIDTYLDRATVISTKAEVKSGPQENNATLIEIPEGSEVYVNSSTVNDTGAWKQITIPGNLTGWVSDKALMMTSGEGPF